MRKRYEKKDVFFIKRLRLFLIILTLTAVAVIGVNTVILVLPSYKKIDLFAYNTELNPNKMHIVMGGELLIRDVAPMLSGDDIYLPVDFVKEYIDKYIFWDAKINRLIITTEDKVMRFNSGATTFEQNDKPLELNLPVYGENGNGFLPAALVNELYNIEISYSEPYRTVIVDDRAVARTIGTVTTKKTALRYEPNKKSPIQDTLLKGGEVQIYRDETATNGFIKVRTEKGLIGYVREKDIAESRVIEPSYKQPPDKPKKSKPDYGKINMVWDQVTRYEANTTAAKKIKHEGVTVLSPTWFSFDPKGVPGSIINIADKSYVNWAHDNGYKVWALITDNFNGDVSSAVTSDSETRARVIRQLVSFVTIYDLDGINIDFEAVRRADAPYFLQFLRELAPYLRELGVVLSVDMFVPTYTMYYNRTEIGKVVDYICVMTYDEHTRGSDKSGPVASLPFVVDGIKRTLDEVPPEKVLMGLPFYCRVWCEETVNGVTTRTVKDYDMETPYDTFVKNGAKFEWIEDLGCYYGEYTRKEGSKTLVYKLWLEDERSIAEKLKIYEANNLAGVASWKRGLEKPGIWGIINSVVGKQAH